MYYFIANIITSIMYMLHMHIPDLLPSPHLLPQKIPHHTLRLPIIKSPDSPILLNHLLRPIIKRIPSEHLSSNKHHHRGRQQRPVHSLLPLRSYLKLIALHIRILFLSLSACKETPPLCHIVSYVVYFLQSPFRFTFTNIC